MGEDDIYVGTGPHGACDDQIDGCPSCSQWIIHDGLRQEAANEFGLKIRARWMQEHKGPVALELLPYGLEALVAGQLAPVGSVDAHSIAELLLREEEIDLRAGAFEVLPVGQGAEETEPADERGLCSRDQAAEVYVELAGKLAAFLTCPGNWNTRRGDGYNSCLNVSGRSVNTRNTISNHL